jgi:hypothetical protein
LQAKCNAWRVDEDGENQLRFHWRQHSSEVLVRQCGLPLSEKRLPPVFTGWLNFDTLSPGYAHSRFTRGFILMPAFAGLAHRI